MVDVYITHSAVFLPNEAVDNDSMEAVLGQVGTRPSRARRVVLRNNGIQARHYAIDPITRAPTHTNAQLAAEAIRQLVNDEFQLASIDCLACGTSIPDQLVPGHGVMVHGELESPPCEVVSLGGVCISGMAALKYAWLMVRSEEASTAVATGSERSSAMLRAERFAAAESIGVEELEQSPELNFDKDFLRWMLSDGASAIALRARPNRAGIALKIDWMFERSYANELDTCMYAGADKMADGSLMSWLDSSEPSSLLAISQDVKQLNSNIVDVTLQRPLAELIDSKQLQAEEIDYFLPHYSSKYFREPVYNALNELGFGIPYEKWFTNLARKGNTGSASLFIMLDELLDSGRLQAGQKLLCFVPESGRFSSAFMHLTVCGPVD